jgi:hypothetical protein
MAEGLQITSQSLRVLKQKSRKIVIGDYSCIACGSKKILEDYVIEEALMLPEQRIFIRDRIIGYRCKKCGTKDSNIHKVARPYLDSMFE